MLLARSIIARIGYLRPKHVLTSPALKNRERAVSKPQFNLGNLQSFILLDLMPCIIRYLIPEITYPMPICRTSMAVVQVNLFHIAYLTTEPYHGIFDWVISTGYYPACGRRKTFKIKGGLAKIPSLLSNQTISGLLVLLATSYLFLSQPKTKTRAVNASGGAAHKLTWCCSSFLSKYFWVFQLVDSIKQGRGVASQVIQTAGIQNLKISIDRGLIFVPSEVFWN